MVTCWDGWEYKPGKEKVFLTSLDVSKPRAVIDDYDLRSLTENCGNRDLKQGWLINKYSKKQVDAIRAHVYLTIGMFNMTLAYRSDEGEEIAAECIRRYRVKTMLRARHKCMIVRSPAPQAVENTPHAWISAQKFWRFLDSQVRFW